MPADHDSIVAALRAALDTSINFSPERHKNHAELYYWRNQHSSQRQHYKKAIESSIASVESLVAENARLRAEVENWNRLYDVLEANAPAVLHEARRAATLSPRALKGADVMTSDIICIHQGEDETVCGREEVSACPRCGRDIHQRFQYGTCATKGTPHAHRFVPGRKCPTCDGDGVRIGELDVDYACPTCAASPVRGYLEVK